MNEIATLLDSKRFTIDQQDDDGRTPLMWAVDKGVIVNSFVLFYRNSPCKKDVRLQYQN